MKRITILSFILFVTVFFFSSCEDYLERYPLDQPSDVTFWSTESELNMAANALYRSFYFTDRNVTHHPFQFLFDYASDIAWDRNLSVWQLMGQGLVTPVEETLIFGAWSNAYTTIGNSNRLLATMHRAEDVTNPEVYARIAAEARFFRAYWYHWLISLYGDVPFTIEPLEVFDAKIPRTSSNEIYEFILKELDEISEILPADYSANDNGRVTMGAALALKARAAIYRNDWQTAADAAQKVIALNKYSLHHTYRELFTYEGENNEEGILTARFSRANQLTHETPIHSRGRLTGGYATKIPTQALLDSYECLDGNRIDQSPLYNPEKPFDNRDPRLHATCVVPGSIFLGFQFETHPDSLRVWDYNQNPPRLVDNQEVINPYATFSGYQFRKYVESDPREFRDRSELDIMLIRYAEVLLIYAEAKVELGQTDESVYNAIDQVRERAGLPVLERGKRIEELKAAVRQERKVELAGEGLRYFDIRRWNIAEEVMSGPLYGRPLREYKAHHVPVFDEHNTPHYDEYADELRMFDTRSFSSKNILWPVPQKELDINPLLQQNPGY